MDRDEVLGIELEDPAERVQRLHRIGERVLADRSDLEQIGDLQRAQLGLGDRALQQLDELAIPIELREQPGERLERRRVPGDQRERARVVLDRLLWIAEMRLEDLGDPRVRGGGARDDVGRVGLGVVHVDERRPLVARHQQAAERLEHRVRRGLERERLLVAHDRLLGVVQRALEDLAEPVEQRGPLALVGGELDQRREHGRERAVRLGLLVAAREIFEHEGIRGDGIDRLDQRGDRIRPVAEPQVLDLRDLVQHERAARVVVGLPRLTLERHREIAPRLIVAVDPLERVERAERVGIEPQRPLVELGGGRPRGVVGVLDQLRALDQQGGAIAAVLGHRVGGSLEGLDQRGGSFVAAIALLERLEHRRVRTIEIERPRIQLARSRDVLEAVLDQPALRVQQHRLAPRRRRQALLRIEQRQRRLEVPAARLDAARAADRGQVVRISLERAVVVLGGQLGPSRRELVRPGDLVVEARRAERFGCGLQLRLAGRDHGPGFGSERGLL